MSEVQLKEYVDEQIWYSDKMLKDRGIIVPLLRPASLGGLSAWEAIYWTMTDLKSFIGENKNASVHTQKRKL